MKRKHCINYRKIFKKPIVIFSIGNFSLPIGIEIRRIFIAVVIGGLLALLQFTLLNVLFGTFLMTPIVLMIYYLIPMFFLSGLLAEEHEIFNGKTAYQFLKGYSGYFFKEKRPKKRYASDRETIYLHGTTTFEETRL